MEQIAKSLHAYKDDHLQKVVDQIKARIGPEKIFLLSVTANNVLAESIFLTSHENISQDRHYYLLILTKSSDKVTEEQIQDIVENRKQYTTSVTAMVYSIYQFNQWVEKCYPFAIKTLQSALLCYDAGSTLFVDVPEYDEAVINARLFSDYQFYKKLALEFIAGAELYLLRKQYNLAQFNIHQAAEQLYGAVIRVVTGLNPRTHNMDKLYRYSRYFSPKLANLFPRNDDRERHLFTSLQKAYSDCRFNRDFIANEWDTTCLYERIKKLLEIVEEQVTARLVTLAGQ